MHSYTKSAGYQIDTSLYFYVVTRQVIKRWHTINQLISIILG